MKINIELPENTKDSLKTRNAKIELLEKYSKFLEQQGYLEQGYLDKAWEGERPFAIDEFLKQESTPEFLKEWKELEKLNSFESCFTTLAKYMAVVLLEEGITFVHEIKNGLEPGDFMQHYRYKFTQAEIKVINAALKEAQKMVEDDDGGEGFKNKY